MKKAAQIVIFESKPNYKDVLFFTKHLSTMIKSGVTLADALDILIEQKQSVRLEKTIKAVLKDINNGSTFRDALAKYPKIFDDFYLNLVKVGEESGNLSENMKFLAKQMAKKYNLRKKIQGALLYPALIFSSAVVIGTVLSVFILPKLLDFFTAFAGELPLSTRILLAIAELMNNYGVIVFTFIFSLPFVFILLLKNEKFKFICHSFQLRVPIIGNLIKYNELSNLSRNLGTLLSSGVPALESLSTATETAKNLLFKKELKLTEEKVQEGKSISWAMLNAEKTVFPPLFFKMIEIGEKTGNLSDSLLYLADFYEEEIDEVSKNLSQLLEPVLLVFIGLVVGFLALAIISPIYQLTSSVGR